MVGEKFSDTLLPPKRIIPKIGQQEPGYKALRETHAIAKAHHYNARDVPGFRLHVRHRLLNGVPVFCLLNDCPAWCPNWV